jgi:sugar phosphate isomerase/epimerase
MPTFSIASVLFLNDKQGQFVGDPIEAIRSAAAGQFPETELMAEGVGWEEGPPDPKPFRDALESLGVYPHTIHAPFNAINLASFDEAERKDGVEQVAAAMRFLAEVGGRTIIVHATGRPLTPGPVYYTLENVGAATENAHRSISELVVVAEAAGVRMALENLPARDMRARPLETMQELRSFMADLPAEYVGVCHDVGHTRLVGLDIAGEARIASERLYALHIQDGSTDDDDHLPPGHGVLDFDSYAKALDDIKFDGAWTLEVLATNHPGSVEDVAIEVANIRDRWESEGMGNVR